MKGEVFTFSFSRDHSVYDDFVIKASDKMMSLAFRLVSGATKRSRLESMMHTVYRVPLGSPFEGITSDIIVGKSFNIDSGVYIFQIQSEDSYKNSSNEEEVEFDNFFFTGFMTIIPSQELVKLEIIIGEDCLQAQLASQHFHPSKRRNMVDA